MLEERARQLTSDMTVRPLETNCLHRDVLLQNQQRRHTVGNPPQGLEGIAGGRRPG
jgi:hypothetical protein